MGGGGGGGGSDSFNKSRSVDLAHIWNSFDAATVGSDTLPLAGFVQSTPKFFFGATPPLQDPELFLEAVPRPTKAIGQGLSARARPAVAETRSRLID